MFSVSDAETLTKQIYLLEKDPKRRAKLATAAKDYVTIAHQRIGVAARAISHVLATDKSHIFTRQSERGNNDQNT